MTVDDASLLSRRDARAQNQAEWPADEDPDAATGAPGDGGPVVSTSGRIALTWLDDRTVTPRPITTPTLVASGLLDRPPWRSPLRAGVLVPLAIAVLVALVYTATTLLWPLSAVEPTIADVEVAPVPAAAAELSWPSEGSAAVAVAGAGGTVVSPDAADGTLSSGDTADAIASITKVVTALVVLDEMPLPAGEDGPEFRFTYADSVDYWNYRSRGESALDVPVDGVLTQRQLLAGMLVGSANNYADRLAGNLWPSDAVFADAANEWLRAHGVPGVTVVEPTGMDAGNRASPAALITLAQKAMANPVIADIVSQRVIELPGAGRVENTNALLADEGVVGIKTGTLAAWNLLSAKDITVEDTPVRVYAAVLGQADDDARNAATRALYADVERELQTEPTVAAGSVVGTVETMWGERVEIVADADADVVLWNGAAGIVSTSFDLGDERADGATVGTLTVDGPLNDTTVDLVLTDDVDEPSAWWRLTHPLALFGLDG
ncbi:D-alanyl-D-alanine carboxypeptidase [Microbacterium sp. Marseille-Q6648]|uniref:D-alanyl-D-alanine carboxypeptidase family protein n=1 Tax=Microbacterium sp. Marseille-Q6648 TaxID=2937991 RepID=UPI00203A6FA4|nr:D-alanyl-D-alanine carboxypeptidase [Microbacterium sp. Marseille-Q6648]